MVCCDYLSLTMPMGGAILAPADGHMLSAPGLRNSVFRQGVTTPLSTVVFLCPSFSAAFGRVIHYDGVIRAWFVHGRTLSRFFSVPLHAIAHTLRKYWRRFIHARQGISAMNTQITGKIRLSIPTLFTKTRIAFGLDRPFKPRIVIYRTESGQIDIINQGTKHGVTPAQRAFMLDQIAAHGGIVGGAA